LDPVKLLRVPTGALVHTQNVGNEYQEIHVRLFKLVIDLIPSCQLAQIRGRMPRKRVRREDKEGPDYRNVDRPFWLG